MCNVCFNYSLNYHFHNSEISVQFDPTSYTVTEGGDIELVVTKVGDAEEEVTVTLSTQDGTAGSKRINVIL